MAKKRENYNYCLKYSEKNPKYILDDEKSPVFVPVVRGKEMPA